MHSKERIQNQLYHFPEQVSLRKYTTLIGMTRYTDDTSLPRIREFKEHFRLNVDYVLPRLLSSFSSSSGHEVKLINYLFWPHDFSKVKLCLSLAKHYAMKTYGGVEV
jgi:hypothetical protein